MKKFNYKSFKKISILQMFLKKQDSVNLTFVGVFKYL